MAHIVTDRVRETTTTTGTGAIALGGAVTGFQDFDSQMANADTTVYAIVHRTANEWEVGLGTWNTGNTLSRTTVVRSTNSNAAVNFSAGTKDIFMTFTPTVRQPGMSFTGALTPATNNLAALGSASLQWADLFLAEGGVINWDNGDVTLTQNGNTLTAEGGVLIVGTGADAMTLDPANGTNEISTAQNLRLEGAGSIVGIGADTVAITVPIDVGPGTASDPAIQLNGTTLMTTPSDGAIELDATNFYGTTDAGNRGIIPVVHFIRADATRTFTSNTNPQVIFTSPANGRLTLETGTYRINGLLAFASMSATSGNLQVLLAGGGSATFANAQVGYWGIDGAGGTAAAVQGSFGETMSSPASVITAAIGPGLWVNIQGSFEVSGAGTMQPQIDLVTAAAATLRIGSFLEIWRIGTTSVVSVGQWD